jgi:glycerophosphoryl diester phosphodiesterase
MRKFIAGMVVATVILFNGLVPSQSVQIAPVAVVSILPEGLTIAAHKTGPFTGPENTVQGIHLAKAADPGLTWEEIDIRWNKSNFPVAMHDATVDRTTNKTGLLNTWYLSETNLMNAADYAPWNIDPRFDPNANGTFPVKVPYAWDIMNAANSAGVNLVLDVKEVPTQFQADKLYEYLTRFAYVDNVIYMSSVAGVTAMRSFHSDLVFAVIEYPPTGRMYTASYLVSLGVSMYAVNITRIEDAEFVKYYHDNNVKVLTWTSDSSDQDSLVNWIKAQTSKVDLLITNQSTAARLALLP